VASTSSGWHSRPEEGPEGGCRRKQSGALDTPSSHRANAGASSSASLIKSPVPYLAAIVWRRFARPAGLDALSLIGAPSALGSRHCRLAARVTSSVALRRARTKSTFASSSKLLPPFPLTSSSALSCQSAASRAMDWTQSNPVQSSPTPAKSSPIQSDALLVWPPTRAPIGATGECGPNKSHSRLAARSLSSSRGPKVKSNI